MGVENFLNTAADKVDGSIPTFALHLESGSRLTAAPSVGSYANCIKGAKPRHFQSLLLYTFSSDAAESYLSRGLMKGKH